MAAPSPTLVLYSKPGCGLCVETREVLAALLVRRAAEGLSAPEVEERDITVDPEWERAFFAEIPVLEIGGRRLLLATSAGKIRRFLAEALDPVTA
ncbi:MAG TPA: glutaredoxin family protein [Candidatus Acidoferrum sp.]|nr:glutaredoxin family protein [Candidatus Acidoferrum sp.]